MTSDAEQIQMLQEDAARKRAVIRTHNTKKGRHYSMRDTANNSLIGTYATVVDVEDALINWVDDVPGFDDRDAAR